MVRCDLNITELAFEGQYEIVMFILLTYFVAVSSKATCLVLALSWRTMALALGYALIMLSLNPSLVCCGLYHAL